MKNKIITIIGAGLAGSECALVLSKILKINNLNAYIRLVEMRPKVSTCVHHTDLPAELVCSNSFKGEKITSAAGMLKYELKSLGSPLYSIALNNRVEAGGCLAVDRVKFSKSVKTSIERQNNIRYESYEVKSLKEELKISDYLILCTGPLTQDALAQDISKLTGSEFMSFYDAAAPIISADSIDKNNVFSQNRYDDNSCGDYLNIPMDKNQYLNFVENLVSAEVVIDKAFKKREFFQACQPIEQIAKTGVNSLRFGALKPVGLKLPGTNTSPYAVVQLRCENKYKTSYNMVGFQTNLKFQEQKRIFRKIPGLENAEFYRFGVMHRNTFINAPKILDKHFQVKKSDVSKFFDLESKKIYIAGQLSGTEGYVEAIRGGCHVAINVAFDILSMEAPILPNRSVFGALVDYATCVDTIHYQPMHVNFGLLPPLDQKIKNKKIRYEQYSKTGCLAIDKYARCVQKYLFNR